MSAAAVNNLFGSDLTPADHASLEARWITPELAEQCFFRRVDSWTGRSMMGRKSGNCQGIAIPYVDVETGNITEYQIRLDNPDLEAGTDGELKPVRRYLWAPGRRGRPYITPGTDRALLQDASVPIIFTEGAFKTAALYRLAYYHSTKPRFLPVGLIGVDNFRATIGKATTANGDRADVKGFLPEFERINWKDRRVLVAYDSDIARKTEVQRARRKLTITLQERGAKVFYVEWKPEAGKGIDDLLASTGPEDVLRLIDSAAATDQDWRSALILNNEGNPKALLANAITAFRTAPEWAGVLGFNEFSLGTVALKPAPWGGSAGAEWTDSQDILAADWLQHHGITVGVEVAGQAVQTVAHDRPFHPVREYLDDLKWDGERRLDAWLTTYLGVEASNYTYAVGARWLISAVARIFKPGAKSDCCLILEGEQGTKKSTALKTIADPWFTDEIADLGSKDSAMQTRGVWVIEIAELDSMSRSEVGRIKAFMSRMSDRFRPPYGKRLIESPRQCSFAGSVNDTTYLRDSTGGRRFWPVSCGNIDIDSLARDKDQLWAEARERFRSGSTWWLDTPELNKAAESEQQDRYESDPWEETIREWAAERDNVSMEQVLTLCIEKKKELWSQQDMNRISRCLRAMKWERYRHGPRNNREWRYRRKPVSQ